jgi:hypothetical protein
MKTIIHFFHWGTTDYIMFWKLEWSEVNHGSVTMLDVIENVVRCSILWNRASVFHAFCLMFQHWYLCFASIVIPIIMLIQNAKSTHEFERIILNDERNAPCSDFGMVRLWRRKPKGDQYNCKKVSLFLSAGKVMFPFAVRLLWR